MKNNNENNNKQVLAIHFDMLLETYFTIKQLSTEHMLWSILVPPRFDIFSLI